MDIGVFIIWMAFIATIVSFLGYFAVARNQENDQDKKKKTQKKSGGFYLELGRLGYYVMVASVVVASIYLYYLIFTHQFHIKYVYQYTSRDLSFGLLLSTFWAGQEGSFLFWTLLTAVFGVIFMHKAKDFEVKSMVFLNIVIGFFLLILIIASPFVTLGRAAVDGAGLNPLLQNFWMIIHPPILFAGYAAIAFPLILALAALWQKKYDEWIDQSLPWTVFSSFTLGAGIIIGAFWAYETLGWGGYWGWDPVENSSLIPWLTMLALLHGLLVQKRNGSLRKTNFFLAIISYILVLYSTFLTRSGVLEDFSVHSFQNLGLSAYLIFFMGTISIIGLGMFILRTRDIKKQPIDFSTINRENGLLAGIIVFSASAFLTFLGTSSPIITGILGDASQVDISFYDKVNLPVGIVMAFLVGITPFLLWVEKDLKSLSRKIIVPLVLALGSTVITLLFGELEIAEIIFIFSGYFALYANLIVLYSNWRISWRNIAGPLSHFGLGLILVSIIISGNYASSQRLALPEMEVKEALDHQLTYQGLRPMDDGKNILDIEVRKDDQVYLAQPRLYMTNANEVMREPDVKSGILSDIYISPLERRQTQNSHDHHLVIKKGETRNFHGFQITFSGFDMKPHQDGSAFNVGAVLDIQKDDFKQTVIPILVMGPEGQKMQPVTFKPGGAYANEIQVALSTLDADNKVIELAFSGFDQQESVQQEGGEQLLIEFSRKPFMSILWLGSVLLMIGTLLSFIQRVKKD